MVQVVWVLNKAGNDGDLVLAEALQGAPSNIVEKPARMSVLEDWCRQNGFIEHPTTLCAQFGPYLRVFAIPHRFSLEHQRKNNVIATYLTCNATTGLAPNTVIGKAVVVRLDGPFGNPIDLTRDEVVRTGLFLNDLMKLYSDEFEHEEWQTGMKVWKRCFPYYDPDKGDTMNLNRFTGKHRMMDGVTGRQEEDGQEVTFAMVPSYANVRPS